LLWDSLAFGHHLRGENYTVNRSSTGEEPAAR
jgi:hypothetical protein